MSSLEIADLVESRHDSVKRTIRRLVNDKVISQPPLVNGIKSANGTIVKHYEIEKRDSFVIVAQLSPLFTARLVDRWQELESLKVQPEINKLSASLQIAETTARILRMSDTSAIRMLSIVCEDHGVSTRMLPSYTDEKLTKALGDLLKEHGRTLSAIKANLLLESIGFIEKKERRSTGRTVKTFWSITEKGKPYGKNETSPQSPNETQPRWFCDKFTELLAKMEL